MKHELTAKRLQKALSDNGISAQDLANASGVSKSSISQYVNGSHKPSNISAAKIGKILNVNPLWLMGFDVSQQIDFVVSEPALDIEYVVETRYSPSEQQKLQRFIAYSKALSDPKMGFDILDTITNVSESDLNKIKSLIDVFTKKDDMKENN